MKIRRTKQHGEFYKGRCLIALYDDKDYLAFVFDNLQEASQCFDLPIGRLKTSFAKSLVRNSNWLGYKPYLIDMISESV